MLQGLSRGVLRHSAVVVIVDERRRRGVATEAHVSPDYS